MPPVIHLFRTIGLIVAAALLGVGLFLALRPREPVYEGRRLSEWLGDFSLRQKQDTEEPVERAKRAAEAVRQMGTNCLPVLLKMLQARDSVVKAKLVEWAERQSLIEFNLTSAGDIRDQALEGFAALGPVAWPAIPQLTQLLNRETTASVAAAALVRLGLEAIPPLAAALTNQVSAVRYEAISALGRSRLPSHDVVPILMECLHNTDSLVRVEAAEALGKRTEFPDSSVPALIQAMQDTSPAVCRSATKSLGQYRNRTKEIVPLLLRMLESKECKMTPVLALEALRDIAPAEPGLLIPVFTAKLNDSNSGARMLAAIALGKYGTQAKFAVPSLLRLVLNEDFATRSNAACALLQIDPAAAATAGITQENANFNSRRAP